MKYRKFGKTGINISALGFGAMRLPERQRNGRWEIEEDIALRVIHRAFDLGVNYIDTAFGYCHDQSEIVVGKAIKDRRNKIYLSTKMPTQRANKKSDYRSYLEQQLRKLDTDYIDFYHFHALTLKRWNDIVLKFDMMEDALKAKEQGLIRHISFSFHDRPGVLKMLVDTGLFESVLCQYNLLDRSNEEAMAYAQSKGLGVAIMGPVGGGRLAVPSNTANALMQVLGVNAPEAALRFVLANPNVDCALSGMSTIEMTEANANVASRDEALTSAEQSEIAIVSERVKRLAELYCTGCDYCLPCPMGIQISTIFKLMNDHIVYGMTQESQTTFARIGQDPEMGSAPICCIGCGQCEAKCPQNIKIREQLKRAAQELRI